MAKNKKPKKISFGEFRINTTSRRYLNDCLDHNWITSGPYTKKLESKWCKLFGYKHAKAVNSGTSALIACFLSLYEFGAKPNDEIICPALSFIATANAIRAAGFKPVFVDVEMETLNINTDLIKEKINSNTVAICAVNLMGRPCKLDVLKSLAFNDWPFGNHIKLISDSCESYGCKYNGKFALEYCDMEVSSHFAAHILCYGEAGIVSVNDEKLADIIDSVRSHGRPTNSSYFDHQRFGLNLKTTDLHTSIGLGEIGRFWKIFNKRKSNLNQLIGHCEHLGYNEFAHFNLSDDHIYVSAPHAFNIVIKPPYNTFHGIDKLKEILDNYNIEWKRTFGAMPTQHKCFEYLGHKLGEFPVAEYIGDNSIHLPVHQYLKPADLDRIKTALDEYFLPLLNKRASDLLFTDFNGNPFAQI